MNSLLKHAIKISGENRRLAYGFAVILVVLGLIVFREVYRFHAAASEEIDLKKESLSILASSVEKISESGGEVDPSERLKRFEKGIIVAERPSIAAAVLQRSFKTIASKNDVTVASERPLKPLEAGAYLKVPIEFKLKADIPGLRGLLQDLQTSSPSAWVDSISMRKIEGGALDITLVIESAMRR